MSLPAGTRLGEYTVLGLIGAGGMGEVYRARDASLHRDIAVKVLPPGVAADPELRARFALEARAVAALNHPNIVTIFEINERGDRPYIAFELVDGVTLRDRLAEGPVPLNEALAIAQQVADGLAHAHDAGVIHRDIKPRNVMLRPNGQVKILDFGLGKFTTAALADATTTVVTAATARGEILGTAGYIAPEHIRGQAVDARADQFAFGALLYELLSGVAPFRKDTAIQTLNASLEAEPPALATVARGVPRTLAALVARCLAKDPALRYARTRDLVADLRAIVEETQVPAPRAVRSRWRGAIAASVLVVGGVTGVAVMRPDWSAFSHAGTVSAAPRRIVVLPFANVGGDANGAAFADGMVELLTTKLSQLERFDENLLVVPASEVRRDAVASARDAQRAFGATLAVSGSIQRSAGRVRLTLNLVNAATLEQVGGRVLDGDASDVLGLQDAGMEALAGLLDLELAPAARQVLAAGAPAAPRAYDYYVQGRGYLQRFERVESIDTALELLTRAVEVDPQFAAARAAVGEAYWRKYELTKDAALVDRARAELRRAVEIDSGNAQVRFTAGLVARGTGEYESAVAELQRALTLDPSNGSAYRELGRAYEGLRQPASAEAAYRRGIAARPGDWSLYSVAAAFYAGQGRYDDALAHFRRVVELTPDNASAYSNLGGVQTMLKRYDEAAASFEKSVSIRQTGAALSNLGTLYFNQDRYAEAARAYERATRLDANNYRLWANLGSAYEQVPDEDAARAAFARAVSLAEAERRINPRDAQLAAEVAGLYATLQRSADAQAAAEHALSIARGDARVLMTIAVAFDDAGDRRRALDALRRALAAGHSIDEITATPRLRALRPFLEQTR